MTLQDSDSTDYKGPLEGLNVIDFGHYYAGPMAAMLLADQGANVIRIVRPDEPHSSAHNKELPDQQFSLLNRNKKLLILDLKSEEGKVQALSLIKRADVVIENFRPGVMKRLGLDYQSVKGNNPSLIYLSLPGFASNDKERAHLQAWEGILSAAALFFVGTSMCRNLLDFPPVYTSIPLCSAHGSMHGATAIMAALVAREKSGQGTKIEVPLVEAGLSTTCVHWIQSILPGDVTALEPHQAVIPQRAFRYSPKDSPEQQLEKLKNFHINITPAVYGTKTCADGRHLIVVCTTAKHVEMYLETLGLFKNLRKEGFISEGHWATDLDKNITSMMGEKHRQYITELVNEKLLTKPALEWEALMAEAGVPCLMARTRDEWFASDPMLKSGIFTDMEANGVRLRVPGKVASISESDKPINTSDNVNAEHYQEAQVINFQESMQLLSNGSQKKSPSQSLFQKKGDMLKDLKILDLSSILAGPFSSYTLAGYGADVIRVEPDDIPSMLPIKLEIMQGKRSMLLDLKTAPGRDVFQKLVCWADVLIHNCLNDAAQRLGISHQQLQAINPSIISCQVTAFGGVHRGGWENRPGFDIQAQAASGLMINFGSKKVPQDHGGITTADTMAGVGAAFSTLLAVYQQQKTGFAGEARTSLAQCANFTQLPFMVSHNGNSDWGEPQGQFALGQSAYQRLYQCKDDWIYVGTIESQAHQLAKCVTGDFQAGETAIEKSFSQHDCQHWLTVLMAADIPCHPIRTDIHIRPVFAGNDTHKHNIIREVDNNSADETVEGFMDILHRPNHPGGLKVTFPAPTWVRIGEDHGFKRLAAAPKLGENTKEILAELGYSQQEVMELLRLRVAQEYIPMIGKENLLYELKAK